MRKPIPVAAAEATPPAETAAAAMIGAFPSAVAISMIFPASLASLFGQGLGFLDLRGPNAFPVGLPSELVSGPGLPIPCHNRFEGRTQVLRRSLDRGNADDARPSRIF